MKAVAGVGLDVMICELGVRPRILAVMCSLCIFWRSVRQTGPHLLAALGLARQSGLDCYRCADPFGLTRGFLGSCA